MFCPVDGTELDPTSGRSVGGDQVYRCPKCEGLWLRRIDALGDLHMDEVREGGDLG